MPVANPEDHVRVTGRVWAENDATGYQGSRTVTFTAPKGIPWTEVENLALLAAFPDLKAGNGGTWVFVDAELETWPL